MLASTSARTCSGRPGASVGVGITQPPAARIPSDPARRLGRCSASSCGVSDSALHLQLDGVPPAPGAEGPPPPHASELADDLERLGPTFIKLGQLLSTRTDVLPPAYTEALTRLQDAVEPMSLAEVVAVFEQDLGMTPHDAFDWFDETPLASASLGQVHRARLGDGREVVVKVQRPGVRAQVADDIETLTELARLLDDHTDIGRRVGFEQLVRQFARTLTEELDYRREA